MLVPDVSFHSSQVVSPSMSTVGPPTGKPGSTIEPLDEHGSAVRFETQCIVIPDHAYNSRRPRVITKSYALPLWKRRTFSPGPSTSAPPGDTSFEDNQSHLVLRLPLPIFSPKPHWKARSPDDTPLPPCLVHRPQASGPSSPTASSPTRQTRTPPKPSPSPPRSDVVTVPLRPCCAACQPVTEAALADGDTWIEHFSRGASRRRSLSVDGGPRTITIAGSAASASYGDLGVSISVDEIDKRRRRSNVGSLATNLETLRSQGEETKEGCSTSSILRRIGASKSSVADARFSLLPIRTMPTTLRIPEEDDEAENENELFPLPSPKRTPTGSPPPSPVGSVSSLTVVRSNQRSAPRPTPSVGSGDSAESTEQRFFTPPLGPSPSLSLPDLSGSTTLSGDPSPVPSPRLLSTLPSISGRHRSRSPSPPTPCMPPTPSDILPFAMGSVAPKKLRSNKPLPELPHTMTPTPGALQPSPHHSPVHIRLPWRSKRPASAGAFSTPSLSPPSASEPPTSFALSSPGNRMKSFSMPNPRHIVESVIRGVGAMGPGGVGIGVMPPGGVSPGI